MYNTQCSVNGCETYVSSNGLCSKHYQRMRTYGNPSYFRIKPKYQPRCCKITVHRLCSVENCRKRAIAKGYCDKHYTRLRKNGNVNTVTRIVGENRTANPLYKSYHAMLDRCYNSNNTMYRYYGDRGITVCDHWLGLDGFSHFIKDMGERPEGMTLDRTNNSEGYSPENCQWASRTAQQLNRRVQSNNTSGYKGVNLYKNGKWVAQIYIKGTKKHLGYFDSIEDAIKARKRAE